MQAIFKYFWNFQTIELPQSVCRAIRREIIKSAASGKQYGCDITGILEATSHNQLIPYKPDEGIRQSLTDALDKANKHVLDALSTASRNVTQALDKANRDVETALIYVMQEVRAFIANYLYFLGA